jgi:hypothetical protein
MIKQLVMLMFVLATAALAACGGTLHARDNCGTIPPPVPVPEAWLIYPMPDATGVPVSVGNLIFVDQAPLFTTVAVTSPYGPVPLGTFTAAPTPIPSPHSTQFTGTEPYVEASVPTLSASTTYTVTYSYMDWADNPPTCQALESRNLGSFTTQ